MGLLAKADCQRLMLKAYRSVLVAAMPRYERGCQEKNSLPSPRGNQDVVTYIQPCLLLRGAFDFAALDRRVVQRRCQPQSTIPT